MSANGRESLLRLRALTQRFAAPVAAFAEAGIAEAALDLLAGERSVPFVDLEPSRETGLARPAKPRGKASPSPAPENGLAAAGRETGWGGEGASRAGARPGAEAPGRIGAGASPSPGPTESRPERKEGPEIVGKGSGLREAEPPVFRLGGARGVAGPAPRQPGREGIADSGLRRRLLAATAIAEVAGESGGVDRFAGSGPGSAPLPETTISRPDPDSQPPAILQVATEPAGLGLVASLLGRLEAVEASPGSLDGSEPERRRAQMRPQPAWERQGSISGSGAAPARGETVPESAGGPPPRSGAEPLDRSPLSGSPAPWPGLPAASGALRSGARLDRSNSSPAPEPALSEPVGLGLVSGLLARLGPEAGSGNGRRGNAPADRTPFGGPPTLRNRERPAPPAGAEVLRKREVFAGVGAPSALAARPISETPSAPSSLASRPVGETRPRKATAEEAVPFGGLAASPPEGAPAFGADFASPENNGAERGPAPYRSASDLAAPPFPVTQAASPELDPDLLADLVNDALVAQAVRFGVDLS